MKGKTIALSKHHMEGIELLNDFLPGFLREFRYTMKPQKPEIVIVGQEDWEKFYRPEKSSFCDLERGVMYFCETYTDSPLRFCVHLTHEWLHWNLHPSNSRIIDAIMSLEVMNEAVLSVLQRKFYHACLKYMEFVRKEVQETQEIVTQYPIAVYREMEERDYCLHDVFLMRKIPVDEDANSFQLELRVFPYLMEYRLLRRLIRKWEPDATVCRSHIEDLLIDTVPSGRLRKLAHSFNQRFGANSFRRFRRYGREVYKLYELVDALPEF